MTNHRNPVEGALSQGQLPGGHTSKLRPEMGGTGNEGNVGVGRAVGGGVGQEGVMDHIRCVSTFV